MEIETIKINTFLPMRNEFVYSCSIEINALGFNEHWKGFSTSSWLWKCFPCKKLVEMLEEVVVCWWERSGEYCRTRLSNWTTTDEYSRWGKTSYPNSFNFWSLGCTTCGQALSWRRIGPIPWINASFRCCSFQHISLMCWVYFSDVMVSARFRKL